MSGTVADEVFGFDDEFDPLAVDDLDIDQEDMDEDNPLDTVDYPTMRNMPGSGSRDSVYTPDRQGSVRDALLLLVDHNPARRPVLLNIIGLCRNGCSASALASAIEAQQLHNRSVFAPMTLCRMLERAGALELEMPKVAKACESPGGDVEYLEIGERIDPVWRATDEALAVHGELTDGTAFCDLVLDRDVRYVDVYRAVMEAVDERPLGKGEIEEVVDAFEIVLSPRRFGGHFIDILERTDALQWKDHAWQLTDLGRKMLASMAAERR